MQQNTDDTVIMKPSFSWINSSITLKIKETWSQFGKEYPPWPFKGRGPQPVHRVRIGEQLAYTAVAPLLLGSFFATTDPLIPASMPNSLQDFQLSSESVKVNLESWVLNSTDTGAKAEKASIHGWQYARFTEEGSGRDQLTPGMQRKCAIFTGR